MIVVDASLAVKWLLVEPGSARAIAFLGNFGARLAGTDLLFVEVASAIVRRANIDPIERGDARRALAEWHMMQADGAIQHFAVTPDLVAAAADLALFLGHPVKDCLYLALAVSLDCELATCDARFARKAMVDWPQVRLLEAYD